MFKTFFEIIPYPLQIKLMTFTFLFSYKINLTFPQILDMIDKMLQRHKLIQGHYKLQNIYIEDLLGVGNAKVYQANIQGNNHAIKQIEIKNQAAYQNFLDEVRLMKDLSDKCQYVIKYDGYFTTQMQISPYEKVKYAFIVMQCGQINLQQFIAQRRNMGKRLSTFQLSQTIQFMLTAFQKLEQLNIAHCDIKPQNILILDYEKMILKLCDVGSCKIIANQNQKQSTILGTMPFLAPELINSYSKYNKIVSTNPFKSDVFSFGLVVLYMITFKKFKSNERTEIDQDTYFQIIHEWIREAKQLGAYDINSSQLLKCALQFNEQKRFNFTELYKNYLKQKNKEDLLCKKQLNSMEMIESKNSIQRVQSSKSSTSSPSSQGKGKMLKKSIAASKTKTNGFGLKSRQSSPSPMSKRKVSSPSNNSIGQIKRLVYITDENKDFIPFQSLIGGDKIFILTTAAVNFKEAQHVTILKTCQLSVLKDLVDIEGESLHIDYTSTQGIGIHADDAIPLKFRHISIDFTDSSLIGGLKGVFKSITGHKVQNLEIKLNSVAEQVDILYLLERLIEMKSLKSLTLCLENYHITQDFHFNITEKVSKLNLSSLVMVMNENFIQSEKQMRWVLPKSLQSLYLQYNRNFLSKLINNLSVSISQLKLRKLYLSFQNNNLNKGQLNMLFNRINLIETLQVLILDISRNKLEDLKYFANILLEYHTPNMMELELRMHHIDCPIEKFLEFIGSIKQLFEFKLKILKLQCSRTMKKAELNKQIQNKIDTNKIQCDIIGKDNTCFNIYLKKKQKKHNNHTNTVNKSSTKIIGGIKIDVNNKKTVSTKEKSDSLFNLVPTNSIVTSSPNISLPSSRPQGLCFSFYRASQSFENYQCLSCCQVKQSFKYTYFCNWCIDHCAHKGHNVIKSYSYSQCDCAYSGACNSDVKQILCGQQLGIRYKKQFKCLKCNESLCFGCIQVCKQEHPKWIAEVKGEQMRYFQCLGRKAQGNGYSIKSETFIK